MTLAPSSLSACAAILFGLQITPACAAPKEQSVSVAAFNKLSTSSVDVAVKVGPVQSVVLIGEPEELAKIDVVVDAGRLKIRPKKRSGWSSYSIRNVSARVTTPYLMAAEVGGSGDIFATGVNSRKFEVAIGGSGSFSSFDMKVNDIDLSIGGSGDIEIAGSCKSADISIGGSGSVKAQKLLCQSADISIGGSGDVKAFASKSVDTSIAGSGDVVIYGNPAQRQKSIVGGGSVVYQ